jgi:hypothetical protein
VRCFFSGWARVLWADIAWQVKFRLFDMGFAKNYEKKRRGETKEGAALFSPHISPFSNSSKTIAKRQEEGQLQSRGLAASMPLHAASKQRQAKENGRGQGFHIPEV